MTCRVEISEAAEAEAERGYLWMLQPSPERAARCYDGLLKAVESLSELPARCPLAPENDQFAAEVRQLLYGRGSSVYRILFTIRESVGDPGELTVRILHIRHGAQRRLGESAGEEVSGIGDEAE